MGKESCAAKKKGALHEVPDMIRTTRYTHAHCDDGIQEQTRLSTNNVSSPTYKCCLDVQFYDESGAVAQYFSTQVVRLQLSLGMNRVRSVLAVSLSAPQTLSIAVLPAHTVTLVPNLWHLRSCCVGLFNSVVFWPVDAQSLLIVGDLYLDHALHLSSSASRRRRTLYP